ncbi:NmrA-like family protein-like protein [Talaromyces proteolyticus]|uniref:NmrA-like family protein-like protein n=1 Tax=Talaromyces proteolyticus TaxID=1131652 RepID=A0AAD4KGG7_9EURO|nr:NmrA-like family protein-like protein [Talaromyces proteolyticus]KAH8691818.1 NmrA-like family protein-like protein [Talaromyces proteolyticus]
MSKIITVVGATGTQGGSVVSALQKDTTYKIRAITRNPTSDLAKSLQSKGIEVVQADADDLPSLIQAFSGSHAIFAVSDFVAPFAAGGPDHAVEVESQQGINLAKAASATATLQHYVWSTLPNSKTISGGRIVVPHFESKNLVDDYIKSDAELLAKTTFFMPGFYADNYLFPMLTPIPVPGTGDYMQLNCTGPDIPIATVGHAKNNIGLFVRAILENSDRTLRGNVVLGSTGVISLGELLKTWGKVNGKQTHYVQTSRETYDALWPNWGEEMALMFGYFELMGSQAWTGAEGGNVLKKDDLGVEDLLDAESYFKEVLL